MHVAPMAEGCIQCPILEQDGIGLRIEIEPGFLANRYGPIPRLATIGRTQDATPRPPLTFVIDPQDAGAVGHLPYRCAASPITGYERFRLLGPCVAAIG